MRVPANLTFFIDDCHVSATISHQESGKPVPIFTSDKKGLRNLSERESTTLSLLKEISKDIRDWLSKSEFRNHEIQVSNVILSPSWYISHSNVISKESPRPIVFSEKIIMDAATESMSGEDNVFKDSKDLLLIEKDISHICLNGYPVSGLENQRATICKATVYYCYMNRNFNKQIRDAVKVLTSNPVFHSLAKITTRDIISENVVSVSFCSYITEVVYLHNNTNLNILSLPFGYKETLHKMNEHLSSDHAATESLLDLFLADKLKPESRNLVLELLHRMSKDWGTKVMRGISQLPKSPDPNTNLLIYAIDKRQGEIAKMFTQDLPFYQNKEIPVTLFNQIVL